VDTNHLTWMRGRVPLLQHFTNSSDVGFATSLAEAVSRAPAVALAAAVASIVAAAIAADACSKGQQQQGWQAASNG